jgi:perosamine synthetase
VTALVSAAECARRDRSYLSALSGAGPIAALERDLASFVETPHVVAVSSGTTALYAALLAVGVKPGDQVIVPAYTWSQTVAPVLHIGAIPRFVDIEPDRYGLDPVHVARAITPKTRAIIIVHLYGHPADVMAMRRLANTHGIALVEDCAQAMGARLKSGPVGRLGDVGCFSLGAGKPLTGGEGGFIVTGDQRLFERCIRLTQHPIRQHFDLWGATPSDFGLSGRMHPLAAVVARSELQSLDARIERRARFFESLGRALDQVPGVHPRRLRASERSANYRYCPTFEPEDLAVPISRPAFVDALRREGVPVAEDPIARPLHRRATGPSGRVKGRRLQLPMTDARCRVTGLAFAPELAEVAREGTIEEICRAFEKVAFHSGRIREHCRRFRAGVAA